jgi:hypothetical protein
VPFLTHIKAYIIGKDKQVKETTEDIARDKIPWRTLLTNKALWAIVFSDFAG